MTVGFRPFKSSKPISTINFVVFTDQAKPSHFTLLPSPLIFIEKIRKYNFTLFTLSTQNLQLLSIEFGNSYWSLLKIYPAVSIVITVPISERYLPERDREEREWVASHRTLDWLNATERRETRRDWYRGITIWGLSQRKTDRKREAELISLKSSDSAKNPPIFFPF